MTRAAAPARLANVVWMRFRQVDQHVQRLFAQMWLVTQRNQPMSQGRIPAGPPRRALNGAEHAAFRLRISDAMGDGKTESVQLGAYSLIRDGMNHGDLP